MTFIELNQEIRSKIAWGLDSDEIINFAVVEAGLSIGEGCIASILLVDDGGLLRNGYSPQLPADYLRAIDGIQPHPDLGTCASAAATGEVTITPDFCADAKWAELKHLPLSIGYKGAWSIPMKDPEGNVIGTFGVYTTTTRAPSHVEIAGTKLLAETLATILCERKLQIGGV